MNDDRPIEVMGRTAVGGSARPLDHSHELQSSHFAGLQLVLDVDVTSRLVLECAFQQCSDYCGPDRCEPCRAAQWNSRILRQSSYEVKAQRICRHYAFIQTSSSGESGPQIVIGTFITFLLVALWKGTMLMKSIGSSSVTIFSKVA